MVSAEERPAVLILGGGPAGLATGLRIVRSGSSAVVVERGRYNEIRVGEHLPPGRGRAGAVRRLCRTSRRRPLAVCGRERLVGR